MIDSYHDKRTGYEFIVNPVGVKSDYSIAGDGNEDAAWNAIWDVATHVDAQGWSAEYRIPFSQLRFARAENMTFGFLVWRDLARHTAVDSTPEMRIALWERRHGLALPRDPMHPLTQFVAASTDLAIEQVREEQKNRARSRAAART